MKGREGRREKRDRAGKEEGGGEGRESGRGESNGWRESSRRETDVEGLERGGDGWMDGEVDRTEKARGRERVERARWTEREGRW